VYKRFNAQRHRGTEGFGYIAIHEGVVVSIQRAKTEKYIHKLLMKESASEILFHHRKPTSTPNFIGTTHPIIVSDPMFKYDYVMVHNGIVYNCDELKDSHEQMGFQYKTEYKHSLETNTKTKEKLEFNCGFVERDGDEDDENEITEDEGYNDSESLALELAMYAEGWHDKIDIDGNLAFVMYQLEKKDDVDTLIGAKVKKMFYGHNIRRPLVLEAQVQRKKKKKNKKHTEDIIVLKSEGKGKDLDINVVYSVTYDNEVATISQENLHLGTPRYPASTGSKHSTHNVYNENYKSRGMGYDAELARRADEPVIQLNDEGVDKGMEEWLESQENARQQALLEDGNPQKSTGNKALEDRLTAMEANALNDRFGQVLAELNALSTTIADCQEEYKKNIDDSNIKTEILMYKEEYMKCEKEYYDIQDEMIERGVPIPTMAEIFAPE
jgi:hypothetical protein